MNETLKQKQLWLAKDPAAVNDYNNIRFADDKFAAGKQWLLSKKPEVNMENPKTIVDFICKYKYEDLNPLKPAWADKIAVYQKLYDMGLECLHIPMIGEYEKYWYKPTVKEIGEVIDIALSKDYSCIIKCNHGSGWNIKLTPGENVNRQYLVNKLNEWLHTNYAYIAGYEWQYESIVPGLLIQPMYESNPLDWQFYCLDGEIVAVDIQRKFGKSYVENLAFVDSKGDKLSWYIGATPTIDNLNQGMKKILDRMTHFVLEIAKQFKFVRVDLFNTPRDEIRFCEATFAPCSGILDLTNR